MDSGRSAVLDLALDAAEANDVGTLAGLVDTFASTAIPHEWLVFATLSTGRLTVHTEAALPPSAHRGFERYHHTHPLVTGHVGGTLTEARRVSDVASDRQWRASPIHRECHALIGGQREMTVPVALSSYAVTCLAVQRTGRDFSDREVQLLTTAARPVRSALARLGDAAGAPLGTAPSVDSLRARLPLTRRQAEVLLALVEGDSNLEVAVRLGISVHTAKRHVEDVLQALAVPHRAAAVARALSG